MQTKQTDPIIAEARAIRQAYAARFGRRCSPTSKAAPCRFANGPISFGPGHP